MSSIFNKPSIEDRAYQVFMRKFKNGDFAGQRLGQAFYNHFNLHKLADQVALKNLYEKDGEQATSLIKQLFEFN